eukprot:11229682-Alexandrium_andersonii.AAC.1
MSASLVGSEMCIRDSISTTARTAPTTSDRALTRSRDAQPARPAPRAPGAVSYTHLTLPTICSV